MTVVKEIMVSIAEYMEQQLEDDESTLVLCQTSKFSHMKRDSVLTVLLFQSESFCISLDSNHFPANSFTFVGILCVLENICGSSHCSFAPFTIRCQI